MKNLVSVCFIIIFCACSNDDFESTPMEPESNLSVSPEKTALSEQSLKDKKSLGHVKAGNYILIVSEDLKERVISILREKGLDNDFKKSSGKLAALDTISVNDEPITGLFVIVEQSMLGLPLQADVKGYIVNLADLRGENFNIVDDYIIQYEISKREDVLLAGAEKETILNISSISEAVLFSNKERKDRDWETSTTSKTRRAEIDLINPIN